MRQNSSIKSKTPIGVLTLNPNYGGGILSVLKETYQILTSGGYDPTFIFLSDRLSDNMSWRRLKFSAGNSEDLIRDIKVIRVGVRHLPIEFGHYRYNLDLWKEALSKFDIFLGIGGTVNCALPLALLDKPFVLWFSATMLDDAKIEASKRKWLSRVWKNYQLQKMHQDETLILSKSKSVIAQSKHTRSKILEARPNLNERISVIPVPIDTNIFCPKEPNINNSTKYLLYVGRLSDPRKNIRLLYDAFSIVQKSFPEVELWMVGENTDKEKTKFFGSNLITQTNIKILGEIEWKELIDIYKNASILLIPSWQEGLGLTGLEAMASGVPVISTDCGGPKDYIIDGKNGFLVPLNNPKIMADKIKALFGNDPLRIKMGKQARATVHPRYSRKSVSIDILRNLKLLNSETLN